MNRADTTMLLRRLHTAYGFQRPATSEMVDEWQRQLTGYDPIEAFGALDRIVHSDPKAPSCARIIAEIHRVRPHRLEPTPTIFDEPWTGPTPAGRSAIDVIRRSIGRHPANPPDGAA